MMLTLCASDAAVEHSSPMRIARLAWRERTGGVYIFTTRLKYFGSLNHLALLV
jgi:hypothetical protein